MQENYSLTNEIDDMVGLVYQGPLDTKPWLSFLKCLRLRADCDVVALTLRPGRKGAPPVTVWERGKTVDRSRAKWAAQEHGRLLHLDPLGNALLHSGDIYTIDEVMSRKDLQKSEFYLKLLQPYGIEYQLGMCFSEPSGWKCYVGLMNGPEKRNFGESEKTLLRKLLPHLERSLELYARIQLNESEKEIFEETLDRLTIGTFILDGRGRVINANRVAQYLARRGEVLNVADDGHIILPSNAANVRLRRSIAEALAWRDTGNTENFVDVLKVENPDGRTLDLLVRTVFAAHRYQSDVSPAVIVYFEDSSRNKLPPENLICQLFGLTPREAFIATLLANGFTLTEAAEKLDIKENTVRSYAKSIYAKMGITRQADLVRLILKSVALLA